MWYYGYSREFCMSLFIEGTDSNQRGACPLMNDERYRLAALARIVEFTGFVNQIKKVFFPDRFFEPILAEKQD